MKKAFIQEIKLPADSPLRQSLPEADFEEAFCKFFNPRAETTALALIHTTLAHPPPLISSLLKLKNSLLRPLGFNPVKKESFVLTEIDKDTVTAKFDDKYFCAHSRLSIDRNKNHLLLENRVRCYGKAGKTYLKLILPLHRIVVRHVFSSIE